MGYFTTKIYSSASWFNFNKLKSVGSKAVGGAKKVTGSSTLHQAVLKAALARDSVEDEEDEDENEHEEFQSPKGNYFKFCW